MTTLYLNIPKNKVDGEGKKSYADTLRSAVGSGYAIPKGQALLCVPGSRVVLLCQATRQRAQGRLKRLTPTGEVTESGMVRYDVLLEEAAAVPYSPAPAHFGRTGVLVVTEQREDTSGHIGPAAGT